MEYVILTRVRFRGCSDNHCFGDSVSHYSLLSDSHSIGAVYNGREQGGGRSVIVTEAKLAKEHSFPNIVYCVMTIPAYFLSPIA